MVVGYTSVCSPKRTEQTRASSGSAYPAQADGEVLDELVKGEVARVTCRAVRHVLPEDVVREDLIN